MCPSRNIFWKEDDKLMSLTRVDFFLVERKFVLFCFLIFAKNIHPYSKMCELCELCELFVKKSRRFCDGIILVLLSRIFGDPKELCSNGERKNDGALISIHRNPLAKSLLTIGILRSLFWRRLGLGRVVRLLEWAEEGCEGLKHGCYDLPCVYFLSSLCHDIKNKISQD